MKHWSVLALFLWALGAAACSRPNGTVATPTRAANVTIVPAVDTASPTRAAPPTPAPISAPVPPLFQSLYDELNAPLDAFDKSLDVFSARYPVLFGAELLPANGNRGTALLEPQVLQGVRVNLDRLQSLGVQGVTVAVSYPLLTPDFPRSAEYLAFFKSVAAEVHQRGMKLDIENGPIFPPPFSSLPVNYAGLTFDKLKVSKRQMVVTIVNEIQPDYLNLGAEPDTEAAIFGIRELNNPQRYADLINFILQDLNRGTTKIGAGSGSWGSVEMVKSLAANTSLDFIALHVYPVTGRALQTAAAMADLAHQYNKRVILDEAWLYKSFAGDPVTSVAANSEIFRRDTYSFWAPLDQKFLSVMAKLARTKNIEYVS
ncbi:MAG: hypothetical protein KGJ80_12585, partial [Chloroflexota bacterium]|nr:hypothetical protein [Chloroflexota bacterium]